MARSIDDLFEGIPSGEPDKALDIWTPVHIFSGVVLAGVGLNRATAYSLILGVEFVEFMFRRAGSTFFNEGPINVISDIVVGVAAYETTRALR